MKPILAVIILITLTAYAPADENSTEGGHSDGHHHEHTAPHGGTLVVIGDEFAHLELVLEPGTGKLTGYVLDGEAEKPVRLEQDEIEIKISAPDSSVRADMEVNAPLKLKAVPNVLTGKTAGDSSEFAGQSDKLEGVERFGAVITAITIKGKEFEEVGFGFPEGNE